MITLVVSAQITTAWTCSMNTNKIPAGATVPTVAELDNPNSGSFVIDLDAVTHDNATETTAFTSIGNAVKVEIDSNWVVDVFGLDASLDITGRIVITNIQRRFDNFEPDAIRDQYTAATDIFRVTGTFQWVKDPD